MDRYGQTWSFWVQTCTKLRFLAQDVMHSTLNTTWVVHIVIIIAFYHDDYVLNKFPDIPLAQ